MVIGRLTLLSRAVVVFCFLLGLGAAALAAELLLSVSLLASLSLLLLLDSTTVTRQGPLVM